MTYCVSKYNIFVCTPEGNLIVNNTLSKKIIGVKGEKKRIVETILSSQTVSDNENEDIINVLLQNGFIVKNPNDELLNIDKNFESEVNSDRLELTLIPTNACNFNCVYCYQKEPYYFMSEKTIDKVLLFIDKYIDNYSGLVLSFFGGEPLVTKKMVVEMTGKIRNICKAHHKPLYANITTNGYELDPDTFGELIKGHMRFFQITLDGPKEIHNRQRPHKTNKDSYERILNNLIEIKNKYKNKRFIIGIRINITSKLLPYLEEYYHLLEKQFGNDPHFTMILEFVRDWGGDKIEQNRDLLFEHNDMLKMLGFVHNSSISLSKNLSQNDKGLYLCTATKKNGYVINHDGKVYKCSMILENEKYKSVNCIGEISEKGELLIDEKKEEIWIGRKHIDEKCFDCKNYPDCMGVTCPFLSNIKNENSDCEETFLDDKLYLLSIKDEDILYI